MRKYIYFTVFVSGMTTLAAELSASRLIGNVFGTSNLVWAAIIGLMLLYLTLGYTLGGKQADKSPYAESMYKVLAWGAFTLGIVPYIANPVLRAAATAFDGLQVGVMMGAFAAVLVLFSVPITLLGMISPYAIRLSMDDAEKAGKISGNIYAISTLGSFLGTYLPVLVLIPSIGTTNTFLVFSLLLLFVALLGLYKSAGKKAALPYLLMVVAIAFLAIFNNGRGIKKTAGQIYETESAYNYIEVLQNGTETHLRLNDGQGVHSVYDPNNLDYDGPWSQFLVGPFFNTPPYKTNEVKRIAVIGLAAGTFAQQATAVYGEIPIDGFEIDPKIIEIGNDYFGMDKLENLNAYAEDGRWGLAHSPHQYDIIAVDAYRPPYIPWHMTTLEFFEIAHTRLSPTGVLTINVGRLPNDRRLINAMATTIAEIFPSVHIMDIPYTLNSIIYATKEPTNENFLAENFNKLIQEQSTHPLLLDAIQTAWAHKQPAYEISTVFTDDKAPIEWITNDMILGFMLGGDVESLQ
ncbi:MAG: fused MFS/spermidine synthase [Anaerolineae bacterium]|jgi:spermidine synthase|nr:fused MFS/spermidine synthase [Anaerolineae bacterium]MBT7074444.1 fused MFS/spermidine synthase [Anaerolineae bacterium]MBT7781945.1 fused MFS/spermidine synthase [Anaerolineae bacterium]